MVNTLLTNWLNSRHIPYSDLRIAQMIGFQPYETFQLLIETGGIERANTLLVAACDAYARRSNPPTAEVEQFEALAERLFLTAAPSAREMAAESLARAGDLSQKLEALVIEHLGSKLESYLQKAERLSQPAVNRLLDQGEVDQCAALAGRSDLASPAVSRLFQFNSRKVYRALADNKSIVPRGAYLNAFARSAQMDRQVAHLLAKRADFDHALLAPAFFDLTEAGRLAVIKAFADRRTPDAPIKKTLEQIAVANAELTRALMKLFSQNRRPEVTRLLSQITRLDDVRCGEISHDTSGAALFVVLRAFGCSSYEGLKVLIHATSHDAERSEALSEYASLFQTVSADSMAFLLSAWRGDVDLLDLSKPEFRRVGTERMRDARPANEERVRPSREAARAAMQALGRMAVKQAS